MYVDVILFCPAPVGIAECMISRQILNWCTGIPQKGFKLVVTVPLDVTRSVFTETKCINMLHLIGILRITIPKIFLQMTLARCSGFAKNLDWWTPLSNFSPSSGVWQWLWRAESSSVTRVPILNIPLLSVLISFINCQHTLYWTRAPVVVGIVMML